MSHMTVICHCPSGKAVRIWMNGKERSALSTEKGEHVSIRIEQQPDTVPAPFSKRLRQYMGAVFLRRKLRYGLDVPSPFRAVWEGNVIAGEETEDITFTLACMDGRYAVIPDSERYEKASVRSYEINDDNKVWAVLLGSILVPLVLIYALALTVLLRDDTAPAGGKILVSCIYTVIMLAAFGILFGKTQRVRQHLP